MTTDTITAAVTRLDSQLPLKARQQQLDAPLVRVHQGTIRTLVEQGRPLTREEIAALLDGGDVDAALGRLGDDDLVVLSGDGKSAVGAYPVTSEDTPHRVTVQGHAIQAMCALDALSVGPMFQAEVEIHSRCHLTGEPIHIRQRDREILLAEPSGDIQVGVRWQSPTACAAHSMCLEMVFLKDRATGERWQGGDTQSISLFSLDQAIAFGAAFFVPLL